MSTPATTIDECIEFAPNYVALVTYAGGPPLLTQWNLWIAGIFGSSGVFPQPNPDAGPEIRKITNWYAQHVMARREISDAGSSPVSVAAAINAMTRILYAIDTYASSAQKTAIVALFNTCWSGGPDILQQLLPWGVTPFTVDPMSSTAWAGYVVDLVDPAPPLGSGYDLVITIKNPGGAASVEARVDEVASELGVWSPFVGKIGVLIDGSVSYPTMANLATELATVGIEITSFGNVAGPDEIDGATMIGTQPTATFAVVAPS